MDDLYNDVYPGLSLEQLRQARENLERYFDVALSIANQDLAQKATVIDTGSVAGTIKERSNANLKI